MSKRRRQLTSLKVISMVKADKLNKHHLKLYLKVLYKINNRRAKSPYNNKSDSSGRMVFQLLGCVMLGLPLLIINMNVDKLALALNITFLCIISLLVFSFVTEFCNLLFDTKDNEILFPRPISNKTVFVGRVIYILSYSFILGFAMALFPMIYLLVNEGGMVFLGFFAALVPAILFSIFISLFLYMVLIKLLGGERFNKLMYGIQVVLSVFIILLINIDRGFFDSIDFCETASVFNYWTFAIPSAWEYSIVDLIVNGNKSANNLQLVSMATLFPLILGWFSYRYLSRSFKQEILKSDVKVGKSKSKFRISLAGFYADLCTFNKTERNLFKTIYKVLCRDKDFMLKVTSSVVTMFVLVALNLYKIFVESAKSHEAPSDIMLLVVIYVLSVMYISAAQRFSIGKFNDVSERYKASPMASPGVLNIVVVKVLSCMFLLPIYLIAGVFVFYVWGWNALLGLVVAFFAVNIVANLTVFSGKSCFPLSLNKGDGDGVWTVILSLLFLFLAATFHFLAGLIPYGLPVYILSIAVFFIFSMRKLKRKQWKDFR